MKGQQFSGDAPDGVRWKRWYLLVLVVHLIVILLMYWLTVRFHIEY